MIRPGASKSTSGAVPASIAVVIFFRSWLEVDGFQFLTLHLGLLFEKLRWLIFIGSNTVTSFFLGEDWECPPIFLFFPLSHTRFSSIFTSTRSYLVLQGQEPQHPHQYCTKLVFFSNFICILLIDSVSILDNEQVCICIRFHFIWRFTTLLFLKLCYLRPTKRSVISFGLVAPPTTIPSLLRIPGFVWLDLGVCSFCNQHPTPASLKFLVSSKSGPSTLNCKMYSLIKVVPTKSIPGFYCCLDPSSKVLQPSRAGWDFP